MQCRADSFTRHICHCDGLTGLAVWMPHVQSSIDGQVQGAARGPAGGIVCEQQLDLIQREAGGLAQSDHVEAGDDRIVVAALPADSGRGMYAPRATILSGIEAEESNRGLHLRYGWQWNIVPLLKIPGVTNVHRDLPLREKLRRARDRNVWPDSAIVRIDFA